MYSGVIIFVRNDSNFQFSLRACGVIHTECVRTHDVRLYCMLYNYTCICILKVLLLGMHL